ncbi:MAG: glycosyltransferase family 4 protein [Thermoguttaceae bacterium]
MPHRLRLVLFFTRGASLGTWDRAGILQRELAIYRRLQSQGAAIWLVTYGGPEDQRLGRRAAGIRILSNRWRLAPALYEKLVPWLHWRWLATCELIKTNQADGAEVALRAARLWGKPLVARCGYLWSDTLARSSRHAEARQARQIEQQVFQNAQAVVVTTRAMAEDLVARMPPIAPRISVIPNYVDTERFSPRPCPAKRYDLVFVGRLAPEKNLENLLEALGPLESTLALVGDGPLRETLQARFGTLQGRVEWRGIVPHERLPGVLNASRAFVLPSHYEGHPKALIEAMACGMAVLGADSPGIRQLVRHGQTGWLCGTDVASLRRAIQTVLADEDLRRRLGARARAFAVEQFSLDRIAEMELALLQRVQRQWQIARAA